MPPKRFRLLIPRSPNSYKWPAKIKIRIAPIGVEILDTTDEEIDDQ